MPIYEYACQDCSQVFERLRTLAQADPETADSTGCRLRCDCGSDRVTRVLYSRLAAMPVHCAPGGS